MEIEKGRIFVLGAGFSAGAGVPLTNTLLPQACKIFKQECAGIFSRVAGYAKDIGLDLESALDASEFGKLCTHLEFAELREHAGGERWSSRGSKEKMALKFYLAKTISLKTPELDDIPEHYLEFCRRLSPNDLVITFNWDCLLEKALRKAGVEFSYVYEANKIHVCKMHGSCNWIFGDPERFNTPSNMLGYEALGLANGLVPEDIWYSTRLENKQEWLEANDPLVGEVKPLLVLPGFGKAYDVRLVSHYWYKPEFHFIRSGGVYFIGFGLAKDDFIIDSFLRYLFARAIVEKTKAYVINPDPSCRAAYDFVLKRRESEFVKTYFDADFVQKFL